MDNMYTHTPHLCSLSVVLYAYMTYQSMNCTDLRLVKGGKKRKKEREKVKRESQTNCKAANKAIETIPLIR